MPNRNKRVVIIEDEPDLCLLLKEYFTRKNCEVTVSNTLGNGLSVLKNNSADIVFLDNNLPDGPGWSIAPEIATINPQAHIVLISAFNPTVPEMPAESRYWIIEKPIAFSDLDKRFASFS